MQETEEEQKKELTLQVFQYSDYEYVIGLVDFDQLNSSDFAFTINHVLALIYDEDIENYRQYFSKEVDKNLTLELWNVG